MGACFAKEEQWAQQTRGIGAIADSPAGRDEKVGAPLSINVQTPDGESYTQQVWPNELAVRLKTRIYASQGGAEPMPSHGIGLVPEDGIPPPCATRLLFGEIEMRDTETIAQHGIEEDATLLLRYDRGITISVTVEGEDSPWEVAVWPQEVLCNALSRVLRSTATPGGVVIRKYRRGEHLEIPEGKAHGEVSRTAKKWYCQVPVDLPVRIEYEVKPGAQNSECIGVFSHSQADWGDANADGLTWYLAPHRTDFTFRTGLFAGFPELSHAFNLSRYARRRQLKPNKWHSVVVDLCSNSASYSVNGTATGKAALRPGDVPLRGTVGMIRWDSDYCFKGVTISRLQVGNKAGGNEAAAKQLLFRPESRGLELCQEVTIQDAGVEEGDSLLLLAASE